MIPGNFWSLFGVPGYFSYQIWAWKGFFCIFEVLFNTPGQFCKVCQLFRDSPLCHDNFRAFSDSCWRGAINSRDNFWTIHGVLFHHVLGWRHGTMIFRDNSVTCRGDFFAYVCKWCCGTTIMCDNSLTCREIYFAHVSYCWRGAIILCGNSCTCHGIYFAYMPYCSCGTAILRANYRSLHDISLNSRDNPFLSRYSCRYSEKFVLCHNSFIVLHDNVF